MMLYIKYIVSICLLLGTINALAQDSLQVEAKDSVMIEKIDTLIVDATDSLIIEEEDTTQLNSSNRYFFILLGTDYGKLISTIANFESKYEFNVSVQFAKRVRITADYGYGKLSPPNAIENGTYSSLGNYYRVGLDYIFNIAPKTYLSLGGMYASSSFKDEGTVVIASEVWPSLTEGFTRNDLSASWAEFVLTSETTIFNRDQGFLTHWYWGIKFRFRFLIDRPRPENFDVFAIPGYGRTWNDLVPAANLFIVYKL
jgi:Domain of unknown function (DUF6048)